MAAIQNNFTKYTPTAGIAELKKAIQASYQAEQEYAAKDNQIVVSPGSKYGLFLLLQAVIDPGDEVIVPLPYLGLLSGNGEILRRPGGLRRSSAA